MSDLAEAIEDFRVDDDGTIYLGIETTPRMDRAAQNLRLLLDAARRVLEAEQLFEAMVCLSGCGDLSWTIREWSRMVHKHVCESRREPYCQTHPDGCGEQVQWCETHNAQQYGSEDACWMQADEDDATDGPCSIVPKLLVDV